MHNLARTEGELLRGLRELSWIVSTLLVDLYARLAYCVSMCSVFESNLRLEQDSRMFNLGLVARASHSPILGRSKSPRRCSTECSGTTSSRRGVEILPPGMTVDAGKQVRAENLTVITKGDSVNGLKSHTGHTQFPSFQPATCHGILSDLTASYSPKQCPVSAVKTASSAASANTINYDTLPVDELAIKMKDHRNLLVVDCRSFISYNMNHITGALNASCCDRLTKKRLQCGKVKLADVISPGQEAKDEFQKKHSEADAIVLYDDNTEDVDKMTCNNPLALVYKLLLKTGKVSILRGGISAFQRSHANLCSKPDHRPEHSPLFSPTTPVVDSDIDTATATLILPHLFVGNERDASDRGRLDELGITHVLNVTSHLPNHHEGAGITYRRLPASDSAHQNLRPYFEEAFAFVEGARALKGKVLIHCQAGVSRSSTLTIAYIMKYSGLPMTSAFQFVKSKRAIIAPNFNFMGQLMEFEKHLGETSLTRDLPLKLTLSED